MDKNIPKGIICLTLINCTVHYPKRLLMKLRFSNVRDENMAKDIICLTLLRCTVHYIRSSIAIGLLLIPPLE